MGKTHASSPSNGLSVGSVEGITDADEPPCSGSTPTPTVQPPTPKEVPTTTTTAGLSEKAPAPTRSSSATSVSTSANATLVSTLDFEAVAEAKNLGLTPHAVPALDVCKFLKTDPENGLDATVADDRLKSGGLNKMELSKGTSNLQIFMRQISNSLTVVLVLVMALSFAIDDYIEASVVTAVILFNIVIGFWQDSRAESQMQALQNLASPTCHVTRSGAPVEIKAETLVIGDIVRISVGDRVPADIRLVESMNLSADEAILTGESLPISKHADRVLPGADIPLGDRINLLFSGTAITRGRATGVVVSTGMRTEVGKIAAMLRSRKAVDRDAPFAERFTRGFKNKGRSILGLDGTPLQNKLSKFALLLFALAISLVIIVFAANKFDVDGEVLIYGIVVGVAVIPESLIAVLTLTFTVAARSMSSGNVIVRNKASLEAVGGVTNICSDKTGTLTQGRMVTRSVWLSGNERASVNDVTDPFDPNSGSVEWSDAVGNVVKADSEHHEKRMSLSHGDDFVRFTHAVALCNNSTITNGGESTKEAGVASGWNAIGEPTEIALQIFAMRFGRGKPDVVEKHGLSLVKEYPFDSTVKRMSVIYGTQLTGNTIYTKGALEALLPLLDATDDERGHITEQAESLAAQGLRVLCVATRKISDGENLEERKTVETKLCFIGLAGLYDPPRPETLGAVQDCKRAGIQVHTCSTPSCRYRATVFTTNNNPLCILHLRSQTRSTDLPHHRRPAHSRTNTVVLPPSQSPSRQPPVSFNRPLLPRRTSREKMSHRDLSPAPSSRASSIERPITPAGRPPIPPRARPPRASPRYRSVIRQGTQPQLCPEDVPPVVDIERDLTLLNECLQRGMRLVCATDELPHFNGLPRIEATYDSDDEDSVYSEDDSVFETIVSPLTPATRTHHGETPPLSPHMSAGSWTSQSSLAASLQTTDSEYINSRRTNLTLSEVITESTMRLWGHPDDISLLSDDDKKTQDTPKHPPS